METFGIVTTLGRHFYMTLLLSEPRDRFLGYLTLWLIKKAQDASIFGLRPLADVPRAREEAQRLAHLGEQFRHHFGIKTLSESGWAVRFLVRFISRNASDDDNTSLVENRVEHALNQLHVYRKIFSTIEVIWSESLGVGVVLVTVNGKEEYIVATLGKTAERSTLSRIQRIVARALTKHLKRQREEARDYFRETFWIERWVGSLGYHSEGMPLTERELQVRIRKGLRRISMLRSD